MRLLVLFLPALVVAQCTNDRDCNLNGVCSASSVCVCDAGWTGATCGILAAQPPMRGAGTCDSSLNGTATGYATTWGGLPVRDTAGLWHLHVAEMALHCGMTEWGSQSQVAHYRSTSGVLGPYARVDTAIGAFSHNPVVAPLPAAHALALAQAGVNASYLLMHIGIGCNSVGVWSCNYTGMNECNNGTTTSPAQHPSEPVPIPAGLFRAHTHMSASLDGPWVSIPGDWTMPGCGNNPAPLFLSNGSFMLACHEPMSPGITCTHSGGLYLATSTSTNWTQGAYMFQCLNVLNWNLTVGNQTFILANEDPHLYEDARGNLHIITHNQSPGYFNESWFGGDIRGDGGHFFSDDGGATWTFTWHAVYSGLVTYTDGTAMRYKRERPKLVQDPETRELIALANGVGVELVDAFVPGNDSACTLVVALQPNVTLW